jgi:transporter family-2 protein
VTEADPKARTLGITAAVLGGAGVAVQSKINGELGDYLHDGFAAAVISFGGGLALIGLVGALLPAARNGMRTLRTALRDGTIRGWQCLGGACGALLVASQGLTVGTLGVALFTVAVVAGQSVASLAVDRAGIGPAGPQPLTGPRVFGAVLTIVAVIVAVSDRLSTPSTLVLALLPALAGVGTAWQQAVNGRVRAAAGSVTAATLVNFIVGTTVLALAFAVDTAVRGWPAGHLPTQPLLYFGGAIGVVFIAIAAAVVRVTGVLLLGLGMVAGQLVGAVGIDLWAPGGSGRPSTSTLVGVGLTLVAVAVAAAVHRRPRTA